MQCFILCLSHTHTHLQTYIFQAGLKFIILLPQPSECWNQCIYISSACYCEFSKGLSSKKKLRLVFFLIGLPSLQISHCLTLETSPINITRRVLVNKQNAFMGITHVHDVLPNLSRDMNPKANIPGSSLTLKTASLPWRVTNGSHSQWRPTPSMPTEPV